MFIEWVRFKLRFRKFTKSSWSTKRWISELLHILNDTSTITGWGLDEEYIEPTETGYAAIKPVTRIVKKQEPSSKLEKQHHDEEDHHRKPFLWGVAHICDLDDVLGLE
jgi:hypothetical protein